MTNEDIAELVNALTAAMHALRSYEFGNSATDLAAVVANKCEAALAKTRQATGQAIGPLLCDNCGKPISLHDKFAQCLISSPDARSAAQERFAGAGKVISE